MPRAGSGRESRASASARSEPESMRLRFHCQTAGSSLTAPQPLNNITRGAIQALAAVLGGAQSLHVSGMDEALAIPSELAMKVSLRTQQIILEESGVASTIDPLGGSYAIEALTDAIERDARDYLDEIDAPRRSASRASSPATSSRRSRTPPTPPSSPRSAASGWSSA